MVKPPVALKYALHNGITSHTRVSKISLAGGAFHQYLAKKLMLHKVVTKRLAAVIDVLFAPHENPEIPYWFVCITRSINQRHYATY